MAEEINIIQLEFPENIRRRPGMYIGSTENPSVLLREAIDNSIDELYGYSGTSRIFIKTSDESNPWNVIADNGRGIPITWDENKGMTKMQLACTGIHTGSKFDKTDVAIGLNGVGISASNALSEKFMICSRITSSNHDRSTPEVNSFYESNPSTPAFLCIEFNRGVKSREIIITESELSSILGIPKGMNTVTAMIPDSEIFDSIECKVPTKNLTYVFAIMNKIYKRTIQIEVNNVSMVDEFVPYRFEFTKKISSNGRSATYYVNFDIDNMMSTSDFSGSVNGLIVNRGLNIDAVKLAYSNALRSVYGLTFNNVLNGIRINSIVVAAEVDFSSQTKERCTKIESMSLDFMSKELVGEFRRLILSNKEVFDPHVQRLTEYINSLTKISTINKIKAAIGTLGGSRVRSKVPKSVRDASINNRKQAELFIVEGKSASGSIINTRDSKTQAVLELRGVPMNAIDKDLDSILDNEEMRSLISAIGVGVNEHYDKNLARYGKIIIAADADADGGKISSLVLGFIAKKMTFLIEDGMVFVLRSPLYIQGDKYIYSEDVSSLDKSKSFTRVKGLGELSDHQASDIITNKDTRRLLKITMENVNDALNLLTSTSSRKQLMIDQNIISDPYNLGLWY